MQIPSHLQNWLASFLLDRKIFIMYRDKRSTSFIPLYGVPQGSPLSPILFILYMSDLPSPDHQSISLSQYADDLAVWQKYCCSHSYKHLQKYLDKLKHYCDEKTKVIEFGKGKRNHEKIFLGDSRLKYSEDCKFLGVIFQHNFTFTKQFEIIKSKTNQTIQRFLNLCYSCYSPSLTTKKCIFFSLIRSNLEYCPAALINLNRHEKDKMEAIQRKCMRGILKISLKDRKRNSLIHDKLNIPTLEIRWKQLLSKWRNNSMDSNYLNNEINKNAVQSNFSIFIFNRISDNRSHMKFWIMYPLMSLGNI